MYRTDISDKSFVDIKFKTSSLTEVCYVGCVFRSCEFEKGISDCIFENCVFENCVFNGVLIYSTNFMGCKFDYCKLNKVTFKSSIAENLSLAHSELERVNCDACKLTMFIMNCVFSRVEAIGSKLNMDISQFSSDKSFELKVLGSCVCNFNTMGTARIVLEFEGQSRYCIVNSGVLFIYYKTTDIQIENTIRNKGACLARLYSYVTLQCSIFNNGVFLQETNYATCSKSHIVFIQKSLIYEKNIDVLIEPFVLKYIKARRKFLPRTVVEQKVIVYSKEIANVMEQGADACYARLYDTHSITEAEAVSELIQIFLSNVQKAVCEEATLSV